MRKCLVVIVACALLSAASAQTKQQQDKADYEAKKTKLYFDAAQRHLTLGSWCRKVGLVPQATSQFLRAVEVGEGKNQGAETVLSYMRGLGESFWIKEWKRPTKDALAHYATQATHLEKLTRVDKFKLAQSALMLRETAEAKTLFHDLVTSSTRPAVFDEKGRIPLEEGVVPAEIAQLLKDSQVTINGKKVVRDEALQKVPKLDGLTESVSEQLVLRSDLDASTCADLHALASALLPQIEDLLDGRPARRLALIVFAKQETYAAYLAATHRAGTESAPGLCDYGSFTTLVCGEGLAKVDLHALVLHELSHLFFYGSAPAVMPDWYAEGFAESFGAQGSFTWDGKKLVLGGLLRQDRLEDLQKAPMPLAEMLQADALKLLVADRAKGLRFYAQCWAFQRFLRTAAKPAWRDKFLRFEAMCRGQVLGAVPGKVSYDASAANQRFQTMFAKDLPELEKTFLEWLGKL